MGKRKDTRLWQPLQRLDRGRPAPKVAAAAATDLRLARALRHARSQELWGNHLYRVSVLYRPDGSVSRLSISRLDRQPVTDFRHKQRIKNELAGPETEAVELYPAESRLVDTANQAWLWVLPPGERYPEGFGERMVTGPAEAAEVGAAQRPFEEGWW